MNVMTPVFTEQYRTACACTSNITQEDTKALDSMLMQDCSMVARRPTGYFIKLYEHDDDSSNYYPAFSDALNLILRVAAEQGFRCIELDCAANEVNNAVCFDW
ncbi:hypothetical protein VIBNISOn1_1050047 [Vibrio nigripulchritudo SOn1]|uniref:DUF5983 domain-containing protein n=1 Tax=Vibrio nigripulchritudo SOn1 TaxID=1238450 RepID=A0AAV2VI62_9VIBR|nr:hypothetical protein VIBNISOn1_1050047 [Vibrio nigripulchritudo SOn1]